MGLQITVLLTMIIYVQVLQTTIPVFDSYSNTPMILMYFIITILMICFCLLLTTFTLFLYHVNEYESKNFSRMEAKCSIVMAKVVNAFTLRIWTVEPPAIVLKIASHPNAEIHRIFDHEQLSLGFKFLSDMTNRIAFMVLVLLQLTTLFSTIVPAVHKYFCPTDELLRELDPEYGSAIMNIDMMAKAVLNGKGANQFRFEDGINYGCAGRGSYDAFSVNLGKPTDETDEAFSSWKNCFECALGNNTRIYPYNYDKESDSCGKYSRF